MKETTQKKPVDNIDDIDKTINEIYELGEKSQAVTVRGRVYRLFASSEAVGGRPLAQFVGNVDELVDEDYIGKHFGGGKFKIRFSITDQKGVKENRDVVYNIDETYNKYLETAPKPPAPAHMPSAPERSPGGFLDKIKDLFTPDSIAAFGLAIKTIRELFPKPQAPDYMRLFEIMAGNMNKQTMSDAVVIKAMDMQQQQQRAQSPLSQLKELREIKNFFKEETENQNENSGDDMSFYIKMALEYLQQLLMQNNNNFKAVGAKVRDNPLVTNLIKSDPELAQEFIQRARELYGVDNARALAAGFGYQMDIKPPEPKAPELAPEAGEEIPEENDETQG